MTLKKNKIINYLKFAAEVSVDAGKLVMDHFDGGKVKVHIKGDFTPVTDADRETSRLIIDRLAETGINIISEEEKIPNYRIRSKWKEVWIIDPIDGTKDFIRKGKDFTVNIALISENEAVMGVIYVPYTGELYYGIKKYGAFKQIINNHSFKKEDVLNISYEIQPKTNEQLPVVVVSRSHLNLKTKKFVRKIENKFGGINFVQRGSSLKYCLLAEGIADIFPRFSEIHEWDTAAGQAIAEASGCFVLNIREGGAITYNKKKLVTPANIVASSKKIIKNLL